MESLILVRLEISSDILICFSFWNKRRLTFSARKGVAIQDTDQWLDISAGSVTIPRLEGNRFVVPSGYFVGFEEMSKRRRYIISTRPHITHQYSTSSHTLYNAYFVSPPGTVNSDQRSSVYSGGNWRKGRDGATERRPRSRQRGSASRSRSTRRATSSSWRTATGRSQTTCSSPTPPQERPITHTVSQLGPGAFSPLF